MRLWTPGVEIGCCSRDLLGEVDVEAPEVGELGGRVDLGLAHGLALAEHRRRVDRADATGPRAGRRRAASTAERSASDQALQSWRAASAASMACAASAGPAAFQVAHTRSRSVRLALLAHLVRRALPAADDERDLGLLAAQLLERALDLGALGRARCVGEDGLVADGRDVAHVCMVAQAAAIMRRRTSGRMPPWRRYSASAGESTRASTSNSVRPPSSAVASTVRRCVRCDAARDAADREALAAVEAERGGRLAVDVLQRQHAHADEVGAVDALVALGDHGADAEQQRALRGPVARRARSRTPCRRARRAARSRPRSARPRRRS